MDKKDRAHFLSSIISSGEKSNNDDSSKLWRVNLGSYISNPDMMLQVPTLDNAVFEGQTLFINGERSQYVSRDHSEAILKVCTSFQYTVLIQKDGHACEILKKVFGVLAYSVYCTLLLIFKRPDKLISDTHFFGRIWNEII